MVETRTTPWIDNFQGLAQLPADTRETLVRESHTVTIPEGKRIFGPGSVPDKLYLLLEGTVRVSQTAESGREIVLYRVEAGQSCVLTTACLLAHEAHAAEGFAETEVRAVVIPGSTFDALMASSKAFRDFVLFAYTRRMTDLFRVIDDVAFGRMDVRLAHRLSDLAAGQAEIHVTHQHLATELGTAREVISRQLTDFQKRGFIAQSRGRIEILDAGGLKALGAL